MTSLFRKNSHIICFALFPVIFLFFCYLKVNFIEQYFSSGIGMYGYFPLLVLKHDAGFLSICLLVFLYSMYVRLFPLKVILRLIIVFLSIIYIVDYFVLRYFIVHLTVEGFSKYGKFAIDFVKFLIISVFSPAELFAALSLFVSYAFSAFKFMTYFPRPNKVLSLTLFALALSLTLFYYFPEKQVYLHSWVYKNVLEINFNNGINKPYSPEFEEEIKLKEEVLNQMDCTPKIPENKNIVVVLLESFSPYHSRYFSGIFDLTPQLDRIARENTSFHNFYANGYTSEHALITLLLGVPLIPSVGQEVFDSDKGAAFERYYHDPNSLPKRLEALHYTTEFLTTGDLGFSNKGAWLENTGFHYVEGHMHPYYKGWPRYHFLSAPDEALYNRATDRIFNTSPPRLCRILPQTYTREEGPSYEYRFPIPLLSPLLRCLLYS